MPRTKQKRLQRAQTVPVPADTQWRIQLPNGVSVEFSSAVDDGCLSTVLNTVGVSNDASLERFTGGVFVPGRDGYDGYNAVAASNNLIHAGCMAHDRRRFHDAVKAQGRNKKRGKAHRGLTLIQKLYRVEKQARKLTPENRYQHRQRRARPVRMKCVPG